MAAKAVNIRDTNTYTSATAGLTASTDGVAQRARDNQVIDFSREIHMSAQAMGNSIQKYTAKKSFSGNFKVFPVVDPVKYNLRPGGVQRTKYDKMSTERRCMFKKTWDLALIQDLEDRKGTDIDFLRSFRTQLIPAQARAQDELCLYSLIGPAQKTDESATKIAASYPITATSANPSTTSASADQAAGLAVPTYGYQAVVQSKIQFRQNLYIQTDKTAAGVIDDDADSPIGEFEADTLELIRNVLWQREIMEMPYVTLTAALSLVLRRDKDFKDMEQRFSPTGNINDSISTIEFHGFKLVPVAPSILPIADTSNIIDSTVGGNHYLIARGLETLEGTVVTEPRLIDNMSHGADDAAYDVDKIQQGVYALKADSRAKISRHLVHVWFPEKLYWADDGPGMLRVDNRVDLRHATTIYSMFTAGAMLIDEDYSMSILLKNSGAKILKVGTVVKSVDDTTGAVTYATSAGVAVAESALLG